MKHIVVEPLRSRLINHRLYRLLDDAASLQVFMRAHVFCVWDFQSLLKALQQQLTCVSVPWLPSTDGEACRMINEIVLGEESDLRRDGGHASHYQLYLDAMHESGADSSAIEATLRRLRAGEPLTDVLHSDMLPNGVRDFVTTTFRVIDSGQLHRQVAMFTHAREDLLPEVFVRLVGELSERSPGQWQTLRYYLERHIEIDSGEHGPLAHQLLTRVCGDDARKWHEAQDSVTEGLQARLALWDAIADDIEQGRSREVDDVA
jgi:hypothetical protein